VIVKVVQSVVRWVDKDCGGNFHDAMTVILTMLAKAMAVVARGEERGKKELRIKLQKRRNELFQGRMQLMRKPLRCAQNVLCST